MVPEQAESGAAPRVGNGTAGFLAGERAALRVECLYLPFSAGCAVSLLKMD